MGKVEGIIKSEILRLAKREIKKISAPLCQDIRSLKYAVSQLRKTVAALERVAAHQQKEVSKAKVPFVATPEEIKISRFSPRLIRSLRRQLGITQKELATLAGITVGAVQQWESGKFKPKAENKKVIVALRKLGKRHVRKLLDEKRAERAEKKTLMVPSKRTKKTSKK
ncbi:MAG: hypothetical protein A2169_02610 [Deltaproteobacteria bacterium RBG_13_47_9]|nr:MAG: hypothetical protein A2169_02610 [Deltaproteobacteria bacterium RBG_13_47_9]